MTRPVGIARSPVRGLKHKTGIYTGYVKNVCRNCQKPGSGIETSADEADDLLQFLSELPEARFGD